MIYDIIIKLMSAVGAGELKSASCEIRGMRVSIEKIDVPPVIETQEKSIITNGVAATSSRIKLRLEPLLAAYRDAIRVHHQETQFTIKGIDPEESSDSDIDLAILRWHMADPRPWWSERNQAMADKRSKQ